MKIVLLIRQFVNIVNNGMLTSQVCDNLSYTTPFLILIQRLELNYFMAIRQSLNKLLKASYAP
jgi:hypothetical protein